jgi:integration host factor subunit beta
MKSEEDQIEISEGNNRLAKYTGKSLASALVHFEALTTACANKIVQHISTEIITALNAGYKVYIRGIGSLYLVYYPSRWGRHPKSGQTIWIEESIRVKFKASSFITKIVNANIKSIKAQAGIIIDNKPEDYPLLPPSETTTTLISK